MIHSTTPDTYTYLSTFWGVQPVYPFILRISKFIFGNNIYLDSISILQLYFSIVVSLYIPYTNNVKNKYLYTLLSVLLILPVLTVIKWNCISTDVVGYLFLLMAVSSYKNIKTYVVFSLLASLTRIQYSFLLFPILCNKNTLTIGLILLTCYMFTSHKLSGVSNRLIPIASYVVTDKDVKDGLFPEDVYSRMKIAKILYHDRLECSLRDDQFYDMNFNLYYKLPLSRNNAIVICLRHCKELMRLMLLRCYDFIEERRMMLILIPLLGLFIPEIRKQSSLCILNILTILTFSSMWSERYSVSIQPLSSLIFVKMFNNKIKEDVYGNKHRE